MKTLLILAIISGASLIILRNFGIQTDIMIVDAWVDKVMAILHV